MAAEAEAYVAALLDGDVTENRILMRKFKVAGYPEVLFVDAATEKVLGELGSREPGEMAEQMRRMQDLEPPEDEELEETEEE